MKWWLNGEWTCRDFWVIYLWGSQQLIGGHLHFSQPIIVVVFKAFAKKKTKCTKCIIHINLFLYTCTMPKAIWPTMSFESAPTLCALREGQLIMAHTETSLALNMNTMRAVNCHRPAVVPSQWSLYSQS